MSLSNLQSTNVFNSSFVQQQQRYNALNKQSSSNYSNVAPLPANVDLSISDVMNNNLIILNGGAAGFTRAGNLVLPSSAGILAFLGGDQGATAVKYGAAFEFVVSNQSANAVAGTITSSGDGTFVLVGAGAVGQNAIQRFRCIFNGAGGANNIICRAVVAINSNVDPAPMTVYMANQIFTGTPAAAIIYTTDTAPNILAALALNNSASVGTSFSFLITNLAAAADTIGLTAGAGVTVVGGVIAGLTSKIVECVVTSSATITMYC